jgi:uncharacterized protein (DUF1697 family)
MALVVFLRGVNVGGHRTFRPSLLARELREHDLVNLGAAGTFVARKPVSLSKLRSDITRRLPFQATVMICEGREISRLASGDPFAGQLAGPDLVRFVSIAAQRLQAPPELPVDLPKSGRWRVRVIDVQGRFVLGLYRREMKAISCLSQLDKVIGAQLTTRNWNTLLSVASVLGPVR